MTFKEDLENAVHEFASGSWGDVPDAYTVPEDESLTLGNTGKRLDVCILYADIHGSTAMVDELLDEMAAEYYKAFLHCAGEIVKKRYDGNIQAYDGDRIMAVFVGDQRADQAVATALEIYAAVERIVNPTFARVYGAQHRTLKHTVGIDMGPVLVAKTGVRRDSDLVWVGAAANYAAKLNSFDGLDPVYPTRITEEVYAALSRRQLVAGDGASMWDGPYGNTGKRHYRSNYLFPLP